MASLSRREIQTLYETVLQVEESRKKGVKELGDLFAEDARLIISPNDRCSGGCFHCVADSTPRGEEMAYDDFARIDSKFLKIFSVADFGRRGNPLLYNSNGQDIVDLMGMLNGFEINDFSIAAAIQKASMPVIGRLEDFVSETKVNIETMVTYHHYFDNLDITQLAQDFNFSLKNYLRFSNKILISLLGDQYVSQNPTRAEEVRGAFQDNWKVIFDGIEVISKKEKYLIEHRGKKAELLIPPIDTRVYPLGRFREHLVEGGILEKYETQFEKSLGDYVCPDLVKWPGIILEPNGDLNLCASFEAIPCKGAVASNIFTKPFSQVQDELMQFHEGEMKWFINNLSGIIDGKVSTCKLKNDCYKS